MPVSATASTSSGFTTGGTFTRRASHLYNDMGNNNGGNFGTGNSSVLISQDVLNTPVTNTATPSTNMININVTTNAISNTTINTDTSTFGNNNSTSTSRSIQQATNQREKTYLASNSVYPSSFGKNTTHNNSTRKMDPAPTEINTKEMNAMNTTVALQNGADIQYSYYDTDDDDDSNDSSSDLLDDPKRQSIVQHRIPSLSSRGDDERWVDLSNLRMKSGKLGILHCGSKFTGVQKGSTSNYDVTVDIQHVDLKNDVLYGYLHVTGLTTLPPKITTFFEGEIIGRKHSFLTRKWHADLSVDSKHWKRFPSFTPYADTFNDDNFTYDPFDHDFIYMRWKEKFLVPNHHVNSIDGASYAGFYYICYQRSTNSIKGFYYCRNNIEWFQELTLSHVLRRQFESFEFR